MLHFFDRQVLSEQVNYDVVDDTVQLTVTLAGSIPAGLCGAAGVPHDDLPEDLSRRLLGLHVVDVRYDMNAHETRVQLRGDYNRFTAASGLFEVDSFDWRPEAPLDKEVQALDKEVQALEAAGPEPQQLIPTKPTTTEDTTTMETPNDTETSPSLALKELRTNVELASKVAVSNVALDKMLSILEVKLAETGTNVAVLQAPASRALIKMALPFLIMTTVNLDPVKKALPEGVRRHLYTLADSAQLGASIEGIQTLIHLFLPLLADFAAVTASLPEGNTTTMDDVFDGMKVAEPVEDSVTP